MPSATLQTKKWQQTKLGDFVVFNYGKGLPERDRVAGPYPVYGSAGVVDTNKDYLVEGPGIVVGRKGSVGEIYYTDKNYFPIDTVYYITKGEKYNLRFLYYLLKTIDFKSLNSDAAVPGLNRNTAYAQEVLLPKTETQEQIADVLSTYDDLIENNTRRIKILEEIAQTTYREWFVYFRFPGHKKVKIIDSKTEFGKIPEGWKIVQMKEIADVVDCLHSKKPENIKTGNNILLQLNNILDNGTIDLTEKYFISEANYKEWTSRIELQSGDCVVTNVGRIAAVAQIPDGIRAALGRNMTGIRPRGIPASFLIEYLLSPHMKSEVQRKKDAGAVMDSLNVKNIYLLDVIVPPQNILSEFDNSVSPARRLMNSIVARNQMLRQARDLLLPKLVTGEVEVR